VSGWIRARGLGEDLGDPGCYPPCGVVADDCAVAFLYRCDAPTLAHIGSIVADPYADKLRRAKAIDAAIRFLVDEARALGLHRLVMFPGVASLVTIARGAGFKADEKPHHYLNLDLRRA
jgi:hypothetical protein